MSPSDTVRPLGIPCTTMIVRRRADRGRVAAVALERRRPALRQDEVLGQLVELPVETPGRTWSRRSAIVSATMRPAFAIISISAVDLRMIISSRYPRAYASRAVTTPPSPARPPAGSPRTPRSRTGRRGSRRGSRPAGNGRRAVFGLPVVEVDSIRDRLGRVVRAPLLDGSLPAAAGSRRRPGTWSSRTTDRGRSISASIESSASAWAIVRGNPSRMNPTAASGDLRWRFRISSIIRSSGTRSPASRIGLTRRPSSCALRDRLTEHVPGRQVLEVVLRREPLRLRSSPDPCTPRSKRSSGTTSGSPRRSASSSATPSGASCRARRRPRSARMYRPERARSPARSRRSG